ncbi:MAG: DUF1194 domain-containing protein [Alphaproteobacteria bacterium]|nr:DUF1194 domain-containing protein [Alphaproteobacteria bacterium]
MTRGSRTTASVLLGLIGLLIAAVPGRSETVDLQLVLAADVSSSIDDDEFALQRRGYAAALTDPRVLAAIRAGALARIAVCLVEWSGVDRQHVSVGWRVIDGEASAAEFAALLIAAPRPFDGHTAIGAAIDFAAAQFATSGHDSRRRTIDISGDGVSRIGRPPDIARDEAVARGIVINGLVMVPAPPPPFDPYHNTSPLAGALIADRLSLIPLRLEPPGGLVEYYRVNVAGGPGSFVMAVDDLHSFGAAMANKLVREIAQAPGG